MEAKQGLHLNTAKKIKADLIEKAKIKRQFYKSIKGKEGIISAEQEGEHGDVENSLLHRDEGKFAPESQEGDKSDEPDILYQMRNREELSAAQNVGKTDNKESRQKIKKQDSTTPQVDSVPASRKAKGLGENLSKEERQKIREKKQERWNSQSGSQKGRERGQPNLGARMDLLLERIKQQV